MSPGDVAPTIVFTTLILVSGLVILLQPISKRLGTYLEVLAEERRRALTQEPTNSIDAARSTRILESLDERLAHLEERQEFTDRLLVERPRRALSE